MKVILDQPVGQLAVEDLRVLVHVSARNKLFLKRSVESLDQRHFTLKAKGKLLLVHTQWDDDGAPDILLAAYSRMR